MYKVSPDGINIVVSKKSDGRIEAVEPIRLRDNPRHRFTDISQILNVVEINKANNSVLVWNSTKNRYEIKPIEVSNTSLDGGTF